MKTTYNDPQVKLNTNRRGKTDYDIVVYGTRSLRKQLDDTVAAAIRRYMEEKEIELERERLHNERLKYLPVALNLLKADYPDLYRLIVEYYYAETKTTMADLGKRYGLSTEAVRYRIKSAKEKLKLYITMHENKE